MRKRLMLQNLSRLKFPLYGVELGQKAYSLGVRGILVILQIGRNFGSKGQNHRSESQLQLLGFNWSKWPNISHKINKIRIQAKIPKYLSLVYPTELFKSLCNKSSFEPFNRTTSFTFYLVNPFVSNNVMMKRPRI